MLNHLVGLRTARSPPRPAAPDRGPPRPRDRTSSSPPARGTANYALAISTTLCACMANRRTPEAMMHRRRRSRPHRRHSSCGCARTTDASFSHVRWCCVRISGRAVRTVRSCSAGKVATNCACATATARLYCTPSMGRWFATWPRWRPTSCSLWRRRVAPSNRSTSNGSSNEDTTRWCLEWRAAIPRVPQQVSARTPCCARCRDWTTNWPRCFQAFFSCPVLASPTMSTL
mmetsp:Transcript_2034/g.4733  ORF Transcript_2034/g.4733 Transcript_2034/m.4733 type:complete len:230 (-) Transcript_2034:685-1374(-)